MTERPKKPEILTSQAKQQEFANALSKIDHLTRAIPPRRDNSPNSNLSQDNIPEKKPAKRTPSNEITPSPKKTSKSGNPSWTKWIDKGKKPRRKVRISKDEVNIGQTRKKMIDNARSEIAEALLDEKRRKTITTATRLFSSKMPPGHHLAQFFPRENDEVFLKEILMNSLTSWLNLYANLNAEQVEKLSAEQKKEYDLVTKLLEQHEKIVFVRYRANNLLTQE